LLREEAIQARVTDLILKLNENELVECGWSITAPIGKRIEMNVTTLLAFSPTCVEYENDNFNGLAIFDDSTNSSGVPIKTHCSKIDSTLASKALSQTSHGGEAYIHLRVKKGQIPDSMDKIFLEANIRFVDMPKDDINCGGTINLSSDGSVSSFHSPNYPKVYDRGMYCQWEVIAPTGYQISLTLKEHIVAFEHPQKRPQVYPLGSNPNLCSESQMQINGGISVYSGLDPVHLDRYRNRRRALFESCRTTSEVKKVDTGTNTIIVTFHGGNLLRDRMSGESDEGKKFGFVMEARAECGGIGIANDERQEISVRNIAPNKSCSWIIKKPLDAPDGTKVYVSIDEAMLGIFKWGENFKGERTRPFYRIYVDTDEPIENEFHNTVMPGEDVISSKVYSADNQIKVEIKRGIMEEYFTMSYSTMKNTCGGELKSKAGIVEAPFYDEDFECIWTVRNLPGNNVSITVREIDMTSDEFCSQTYFEVRENNSTGRLIGRFCKEPEMVLNAENLWIKLKYQKGEESNTEGEDEDVAIEPVKHKLVFGYDKWIGGIVRSRVIENPPISRSFFNTWRILVPDDHHIRIHVEIMEVPQDNPIRIFSDERNNNPSGEKLFELSGYTPQADFTIERSDITIFHRYYDSPEAKWRIRWEPVKKRGNDTEQLEEGEKDLFTCGSHLIASTLNQTLRYPDPPRPEGYEPNQHCRWTIGRPRFSSLKLRIVDLSMEKSMQLQPVSDGESGEWEEVESEQTADCEFDYLAVASRGGGLDGIKRDVDSMTEIESSMKFCRKDQKDMTFDFAYSTYLILHFVSDRSREGQGFAVDFTLGCNSFDYIPSTADGFRDTLTSPNYPRNYPDGKGCSWNVGFQSNRRIQIEIVDLDIEDSPDCSSDSLVIANSAYAAMRKSRMNVFCGGISKYNETTLVFPVGRVFIRFDADKQNNGRGFKLIISEILEECSNSVISVDESTPSRIINSPLWPAYVPASVSCSWTLRSPSAHRLSLSIDPDHFELQNTSNNTCDSGDLLEVRDGSSFHSPLIGRYCGSSPPSTIFSTGSYLHVTITTQSDTSSRGFNATVALAACGGIIVLREGENATLTSPNYPEAYPMRGNCTWTIRAPNTHFVEAQLDHFFIQYSPNCTQDSLSIRDGNGTADALVDHWCGNKYSQRGPLVENDRTIFRSSRGIMTVEFIANSDIQRGSRMFCQDRKCGFSLILWPSKIACGGVVDGNGGYLTTPGYPNKLLSRVECVWHLNAGLGKRYQLNLEFIDKHGFYIPAMHSFAQQSCFGDVDVINLPEEYELAHFALRKIFCQNKTEMITPTDQAMIRYSDARSRNFQRMSHIEISEENLYQPFRIQYLKVPSDFNDDGCQILIDDNDGKKNHTVRVAPTQDWQTSRQYETPNDLFVCHISIRRSRKRKGTTSLTIKDFNFESPFEMNTCGAYTAMIDMKATQPTRYELIPFTERICNSTFTKIPSDYQIVWNKATIIPEIDLFVISPRSFMGKYLEFSLDVEFDACGGIINNEDGETGIISSPGFVSGKDYEPNQECQWVIEAPEGHVIKLRVKFMEIEYTYICHKDQLTLSEGEQATVVHRFCHNSKSNDTSLDEKSNQFTSSSRIFVLNWRTDSSIQLKGWQIEYEFIGPNETGCGFITHSQHGIIRSPGAPNNDYGNDLECIWDIQVPPGYVIQIHFNMMDIEKSKDCKNDSLTIYEEHKGRGWAPNQYYYFIFDKSEMHSPLCHITAPPDMKTESNRIRLNFTTNEKVVGRGFELEYKAVCGGVFQLSHGVITSPHYPAYLPNEDMECMYFIDPEVPEGQTQVVTIAINDIQLADTLVQYRRDPCPSDYLQVVDAESKSVVYTYCPFEKEGEQKNLSFSIKGPVGIKFMANRTYSADAKKLVRGFKLTWALNRCGGEFLLNSKKTGYSTTFYSPGYPLDYHDELDCAWIFKTTSDRVFSMRIKKLDIENEDNCALDKLEIHDGGIETNTSLVGRYCGHSAPNTRIYVMKSTMLIRFVTDHSMSHSGFLMEVTATLGPEAGCGGSLDAKGDWNTFSSPTVNSTGMYPSNLRCGWTIKGLPNTILELKLMKMKTEKPTEGSLQTGKKCIDFMAIYDGYKLYSPLIESDLCEHAEITLPKIIHTSNRIAQIYFESDHSVEDEGFTMEYRSASPTCGGWLRATREKQSIAYAVTRVPNEGQSFERCRWVIAANEQAPIWIRITSIKFPISNCEEDYVEIRDVGIVQECEHPGCALRQEHKKTMRECGVKGGIAPFVSNTLAAQISTATQVIADSAATLNIEYYLLDSCNRTVDARFLPSSRLTSPHFPRPYGHNHTCETTVQVEEKKRLLLVFRAFDIEHPSTSYSDDEGITMECEHDYLEINDASKAKSEAIKHCGVAIPHPFMSTGSIISLFLKTDESVVGEGYDISYFTADLMDDKTMVFDANHEMQGAIQQPNYPGYNTSSSYKWFITPPAGHKCTFTIEELDLNLRKNRDEKCGENEKLTLTLTLNDEKGESSMDSCNLSPEDKLPIVVDFQREILVVFQSDSEKENDGRGFRAIWNCENYENEPV
ncbi:hypothetical protein PENTCL1PPCAC_2232, partial [Pristionchus entomophagus]